MPKCMKSYFFVDSCSLSCPIEDELGTPGTVWTPLLLAFKKEAGGLYFIQFNIPGKYIFKYGAQGDLSIFFAF